MFRSFLDQNITSFRSKETFEMSVFDFEFLIIYYIMISTIRQPCGKIDVIGGFTYIDHRGTFFATVHKQYLTGITDAHILLLIFHCCPEFIDSHNLGMFELVIASGTQHIIAIIIGTGGTGRTAEKEGSAVLTRRQEYPADAYLVIGKMRGLMSIGICVMAFNPRSEEFRSGLMMITFEIKTL